MVIRFQGVDVRRSVFLKELEPLAKNGTDTQDPAMKASAFGRFVEERVVAIAAARSGFKDVGENRGAAERWLASALAEEGARGRIRRLLHEAHPEVARVESVTLREMLLGAVQERPGTWCGSLVRTTTP